MNDQTQNTVAQQPAQQSELSMFRSLLEGKMRGEISKALPKDIDPDRFIRTVITAVQMNEDLLYADRRSLFSSCMKAASDGLMTDGREAVLNIYSTEVKSPSGQDVWVKQVKYLPMVRGLLKTIRNSGEITYIDAAAVYEKERDAFRFERGDESRIVHMPYIGADDPGPVIAAYMVAKFSSGEIHREVMTRRDLEKVRAASKAGDGANSPWTKWYDQMAIKSVIKRAAKLLPTSSDRLDRLIQHDNEAMGFDFNQHGTDTTAINQAPAPRQIEAGKSSRLAAIVGTAKQAETVEQSDAQSNEKGGAVE
jgi:recombination protein RecT